MARHAFEEPLQFVPGMFGRKSHFQRAEGGFRFAFKLIGRRPLHQIGSIIPIWPFPIIPLHDESVGKALSAVPSNLDAEVVFRTPPRFPKPDVIDGGHGGLSLWA